MGGGPSRPYVSADQIAASRQRVYDYANNVNVSWGQYGKDWNTMTNDVNDYNIDAYTLTTNISIATLNNWIPKLITSIIDYNNIFGSHIQDAEGNMTTSINTTSIPYLLNTTTPLINKTYQYTWLYVYCSNQGKGRQVQNYVNQLKNSLSYTEAIAV